MSKKLGTVPLVRRIEYLETYLNGISEGYSKPELEELLIEKKEELEREKSIAIGRGQLTRARTTGAVYLLRYCFRLSRDLGFIKQTNQGNHISEIGTYFLNSQKPKRVQSLSQKYSETYPHLNVLVQVLLTHDDLISLPVKKELFDLQAENYQLGMSQVVFDNVRDMATYLGLVNWRIRGTGAERKQIVYSTCRPIEDPKEDYLAKISSNGDWKYFLANLISRDDFRETLFESYLILAEGIPGSPVFYSDVRTDVCNNLRITDEQFDSEIMDMMIGDKILKVYGSEGILPYRRDSAGMFKSLPPKNVWGDYIVYLRIEENS